MCFVIIVLCKKIEKVYCKTCIAEQKKNYCEVQQVINHFVKVNSFALKILSNSFNIKYVYNS